MRSPAEQGVEAARIFANAVSTGMSPDADRSRIAQLLSKRTGMRRSYFVGEAITKAWDVAGMAAQSQHTIRGG